MLMLATSLLLALRQLADPAILRVLLKSIAVSLVLFAALAWGGWWLLDTGLARAGLEDALFVGAGGLRQLAAALLAGLGLWLVWRIVALGVVQFYADEVVLAVERRHYPAIAALAREPRWGEQLSASAKSAGRTLLTNLIALPFALALLATGFGAALLFWLVNAVLVGRELTDMVWVRHARARGHDAPVGRGERLALGAVIAALLAVPLLNLIAPVLGAAAATHLIHRKPLA